MGGQSPLFKSLNIVAEKFSVGPDRRPVGLPNLGVMLEYRRSSTASPAAVWRLLSRPEHWSEWAPHLSGAWGLGSPEVEAGSRGAARVAWLLPVPARITAKQAGHSWRWQVGPYSMEHRVERRGTGCDVVLAVEAAAPLERAFALSYGRAIPALLGRLARLSERT